MDTKGNARRGMVMVLCLFLVFFAYKVLVHGLKDGLLFTPMIGLWMLTTILVYWSTREEADRASNP